MISVTKAYKDASKQPLRQSYVTIKYGSFDKGTKEAIKSVGDMYGRVQSFTNPNSLFDENKETAYNYISCEQERVRLDNNFVFIQDKTKYNPLQNVGYWSSVMSNGWTFDQLPIIVIEFDKAVPFTPLTIYFQEPIIAGFNVAYYLNNNKIYTRHLSGSYGVESLPSIVDTTNPDNLKPITYFDKIEITFTRTGKTNRYLKINEILLGTYQVFKSSEIKNFKIIEEIDLTSDTIPSNSLNITIQDKNGDYDVLNPQNKTKKLQQGQELSAYHHLKVGNNYKEVLLGNFLLKKVSSENMSLKLECYDETYFMNSIYYGSKFYNNATASDVLIDLFTYFNYSSGRYVIDPTLDDIRLTGYIPQVDFRSALRLIAESCKAVVQKRRTGELYIYRKKDNDVIVNYFNKYDYTNDSVKQNLYDNVVDVKIYAYEEIENKVLYSETLNTGTYRINFSSYPLVYDTYSGDPNTLKASANDNYTITELNALGCVVSVTADNTLVELKGDYYIETSSTERIKKDKTLEVDENAIKKIDNHLITRNNYQEIANWKLNKSDIIYELKYKTTPYIEVGDTCKLETKYKDSNGNPVVNKFVVNKIEYDESILQSIKGE